MNQIFTVEQVSAWAWRIPFIIGCVIIPAIFYLRGNLKETEAFANRKESPTTKQIFATLLSNWKVVIAGMLMVVTTTTIVKLLKTTYK